MRDLTEEELKLAPGGCDHYNIIDGKVYFTDVLGIYVCDINGNEVDNCIMDSMVFAKSVPIPKKPFDISKHGFSDKDIRLSNLCESKIEFAVDDCGIEHYFTLNKSDAIAIAKALGVTGEDLK